MLRAITFKNLINFKDEQRLEFEKGVNFIVGANSTGKSSILELIRRCLSPKINLSFSRVYDQSQLAFICSKYEAIALKPFPLFLDKDIDKNQIVIAVFVESDQNLLYRVACFKSSDGNRVHAIVKEFEFRENKIGNELRNFYSEQNDSGLSKELFELKNVEKHIKKISEDRTTEKKKEVGNYIKDIHTSLTETFVGVFPLRCTGPMQWTRSENMKQNKKDQNEFVTQERCEILHELLPKGIERENEKGKYYFKKITTPLKYEFYREDREILVRNINDASINTSQKSIMLLKAPQGIVEAKMASLILADERFSTICYEDMDLGMHHQMIENLSHLVLRDINDKTVIIVTHNQSFMSIWGMSRTFVCSRQLDNTAGNEEKKFAHVVRNLKSNQGITSNADLISNFELHDQMKRVMFASHVLFVEGPTDYRVIRALFDYIVLNIDTVCPQVCNNISKGNYGLTISPTKESILSVITKTQIVFISGTKRNEKAQSLCNSINIPCASLVDRDHFFHTKSGKPLPVHGIELTQNPTYVEEDYDKYIATLKKEDLHYFFWKSGALEDALINDYGKQMLFAILGLKDEEETKEIRKKIKTKIKTGITDSRYAEIFHHIISSKDITKEFNKFLSFLYCTFSLDK